MRALTERRSALEALERILNRGGDTDEVLREVVAVLHKLYDRVAIRFVEEERLVDGPSAGIPAGTASTWPIHFQGMKVAELEVAPASDDDQDFIERVATIVSPYCLAGR